MDQRTTFGKPARAAALALLASALLAGCGYSVRPPFQDGVRTVYVPMFQAFTYRRDLNEQLTELIIKEIEKRTPYKVVDSPDQADAVLEGRFQQSSGWDKNLRVENPQNLPRQLMTTVSCQVRMVDNRASSEKKDEPFVTVIETVNLYPELGETQTLSNQEALQKMARDIVSMMEKPW